MIRRREFIALIGGAAAAWPVAARAQQPTKVWRVGFLAGASRPAYLGPSVYGGFTQGMREHGYVEGTDFIIEWRFAEGRFDLFPALAAELVRLNVDVIVVGAGNAVPAVQSATKTIPVVMGSALDPVGRGFVSSLARPGGNITGLANSQDDTAPKQLELLTIAMPTLTRVGLGINPANPGHVSTLKVARAVAEKTGRMLFSVEMRNADEVPTAFAALSNEHVGAVMVPGDAFFFSQRQRIAEMALKNRLPTIFAQREYVEVGGLMSYGENLTDFYRRAAFYVDRIFKGASPADLPVQQPTRFFLTINLKTAKALGVDLPPTLLARADEVIE